MKISAHNKLGQAINQEVTRVVIYDDYGNPVACALTYGSGHVHVCHLKDKEWSSVLKMLGLDQHRVIIEDIKS